MILLLLTETIATHSHLIWNNVFFYLFIVAVIGLLSAVFVLMRTIKRKIAEAKLMQQQHVARVDIIRKEQTEKLENIRLEMLKREEDRSRQWMESEKETLHVLNGVSSLLDLSEKIGRVESEKILAEIRAMQTNSDSEKILTLLEQIQERIEKITQSKEKSQSNDKNGGSEGR